MRTDRAGVFLTGAEVDELARRLVRIAKVTACTDAAALATELTIVAATVAALWTPNAQTITVAEYSAITGIPVRTVRWRCAHGLIDATKRGTQWQIHNIDCLPDSVVTR